MGAETALALALSKAAAVGMASGSNAAFAVALPLASRWYPPEHQGKALGIAGAGNSGTAIAALMANFSRIVVWWKEVDWCACAAYSVTGVLGAVLGAKTLLALPQTLRRSHL